MVSVVPGLQARVPSAMGEMVTVATGEVRRVLVAMEVAAVGAAGLVTGTPVAVAVALVLSVLTTLRLLMVGLLGKTPPMAVMAPSFWHFPCQMRPALIMCRHYRHGLKLRWLP